MIKTIVLDIRAPRTREEKRLMGSVHINKDRTQAVVYIAEGQSKLEMLNTFFHEMFHAYVGLSKVHISSQKEGLLAWIVGNVAEAVLDSVKDSKKNSC